METIDQYKMQLQQLQREYDSLKASCDKEISGRRRTEDDLHQQETRFRLMVEYSSDILVFLDKDGIQRYISPSAEQITGYTVEELSGSFTEVIHPDDVDRVKQNFHDLMTHPEWILKGDYRHIHKDGGFRYFEAIGRNFMDDPNVQGLVLNIRDITERRLAEKALQESKSMYQAIFESTGTATMIVNDDTTISMANHECYSTTGYAPTSLVGNSWTQYVEPGSLQKMLKNKQIRSQNPGLALKKYEVKLINIRGEIRDVIVDIGVIPGANQSIVSILDITDRKRSEENLRASEKRFNEIVTHLDEGFYSCTVDGLLLEHNIAFSKIHGIDPDLDIKGIRISDFWQNPDARPEYLDILMKNGYIRNFLVDSKTVDGEKTVVMVNSHLVKDEHGTVIRIEGTVADFTERKRAEEKIIQLNETLEERVNERTRQLEAINKELAFHLKEIEQFTYIASHDLQEPLRTLTNFTQLLMEECGGKIGSDGNKYIEFICNSANRMRELVKGLLEYSLLGKERTITIVDCNVIVNEVIADMNDSILGANASITLHKLPRLNGYSTELRLLFQNLINNAIKFQTKEVHPVVHISADSHDNEWQFSVKDNGIGILEKHKETIFVIFKRMHNRNEYSGTGIGLSHCKKIVELHGGRIWVESAPGNGSTFYFTIPKN
jgi:PAS domain S-box-containing protein